jgi:hypothetical protein
MTTTLRRYILRGNAFYIFMFGCAGMLFDIRGVLFGLGPQGLRWAISRRRCI